MEAREMPLLSLEAAMAALKTLKLCTEKYSLFGSATGGKVLNFASFTTILFSLPSPLWHSLVPEFSSLKDLGYSWWKT
jgi:hypothetical protein